MLQLGSEDCDEHELTTYRHVPFVSSLRRIVKSA